LDEPDFGDSASLSRTATCRIKEIEDPVIHVGIIAADIAADLYEIRQERCDLGRVAFHPACQLVPEAVVRHVQELFRCDGVRGGLHRRCLATTI
jgi:hypothetical protein